MGPWAGRDAGLEQDLGMQSSAAQRPRKRRRGPALQLWEICCLAELPSSFSTQDTVPWCHGGGESQTGCFSCPVAAESTGAQRDQRHARPVWHSRGCSDHLWPQTSHRHRAAKPWLQRTLHPKNSALPTCPQTWICAVCVSSPKRKGVKTRPRFKTYPFF